MDVDEGWNNFEIILFHMLPATVSENLQHLNVMLVTIEFQLYAKFVEAILHNTCNWSDSHGG